MSSYVTTAAPAADAFAAPGQPTLADVLERIEQAPNLTPTQRRDYASAINTFARATGRDPAGLCAHPGALGQRLKVIRPAAADITPRRWGNVVSLLRAAVAASGITVTPGRYQTPLSPAWRGLHEALTTKSERDGLSRFAHFCSAAGIDPAAVNDTVAAEFQRALTEDAILANPGRVYKGACRVWNRVVTQLPDHGLTPVTPATTNPNYVLPWSAFPASLEAEASDYLTAAGTIDLLGDGPARRPIRARTQQTRDWQLRQAATALVMAGWAPESLTGLTALVEVQAVRTIAKFLYDRSATSSKAAASLTCSVLRALARDWLKVPQPHLEQLNALCSKVSYSQTGMTERNNDRLRVLRDPANQLKLLLLPEQLVAVAEASEPDPRAALLVQTALMVEILLMAPMRIGNLAALDIDKNIRRSQRRSGASAHLVIPARTVKNAVDLDFPLPESAVALLDLYLNKYRDLLGSKATTALFPGDKGGNKCVRAVNQQLTETIAKRTGLEIHPHLFRHIAAMFYLDGNPGNYEAVRRVLGHRSIRTTTNFYTGLESAAAVRHFDQHVLKLREQQPAQRGGVKAGGRR